MREIKGGCPTCGKTIYQSRKRGRQVIRILCWSKMRAYRCPDGWGWHIGHNPAVVRQGRLTARDIYGGRNGA